MLVQPDTFDSRGRAKRRAGRSACRRAATRRSRCPEASATSSRPLPRSFGAGLARCSSVPARSWTSNREQLVVLTARHGVPAIYEFRDFVVAGGLMSYGNRLSRRLSPGRHLRRAEFSRVRNRPTFRSRGSTKFELVINLKMAEGARPRNPGNAACARRRGVRVMGRGAPLALARRSKLSSLAW